MVTVETDQFNSVIKLKVDNYIICSPEAIQIKGADTGVNPIYSSKFLGNTRSPETYHNVT